MMYDPDWQDHTFRAEAAAPLLKAAAICVAIVLVTFGYGLFQQVWPVSAETIEEASQNSCVREFVVDRVVDTTAEELSRFKRFCDIAEQDAREARARRKAQEAASQEPRK